MSQPVLLRANLSVALVRVLQAVVPALVIALALYGIVIARNMAFDRPFLALATLSAILSAVLVIPQAEQAPTLQFDIWAIFVDTLKRWAVTAVLLIVFGYITGFTEQFPRSVLVPWLFVAPALAFATSLLVRLLMRKVAMADGNIRSAIVVGVSAASIKLGEELNEHRELCVRLEGFFDDRAPERLDAKGRKQLLGQLKELPAYVKAHRIDAIFIALPIRHVQRVMNLLDELHDSTASIYYVPDVFVFDLIQSRAMEIMGIPVVAMCETPFYGYRGVMKRITDLGFTTLVLAFAFIPMLVIAMLVKLTSSGPAIFQQRRYGLDGKEIVVYKFRTMRITEDGAQITQAKRNDPRVTPIGGFLRRFSLDELPQLINVLQGRMSLVGPRPHAVAHNEQYRQLIKGYMIRHKVLPGITGLAQISGCRGETAELEQMQARVNFDLEYLRNWTPGLDFSILVKTALQTLVDRKAY